MHAHVKTQVLVLPDLLGSEEQLPLHLSANLDLHASHIN